MLDKVLRFFVVALMAIAGGTIMHFASPALTDLIRTEIIDVDMGLFRLTLTNLIFIIAGVIIGGLIGYGLSPFFAAALRSFSSWVERQLSKMPLHDVIAGVIGLAIGLIIADLLGAAFSNIPVVGSYIPVVFSIVFGYLGIHILIHKQKELSELFAFLPKLIKDSMNRRGTVSPENNHSGSRETAGSSTSKLLDTSVIIDGRIADICKTGFIDGKLLIPVFVLEELQHIADSSDALKRVRGRRGLDVLQRIRTECGMQVEIVNQDFDDISEVDSKLVRLGQITGSKIITNDYNLNKVSELRGVPVLNINELSNAVKPVVVPGEMMDVTVVKEGKAL